VANGFLGEHRLGDRVQRGDVPPPAALRDETPAVAERAPQRREERVVVGDPVERRRREDGVDPLGSEVERGEVATRSSARSPRRSRAASIIDAEASTPMTRPCSRRAASASVTRPEPQPASSTVSSPRSGRRSRTSSPISAIGRRADRKPRRSTS
jgi:hypothetical protein